MGDSSVKTACRFIEPEGMQFEVQLYTDKKVGLVPLLADGGANTIKDRWSAICLRSGHSA